MWSAFFLGSLDACDDVLDILWCVSTVTQKIAGENISTAVSLVSEETRDPCVMKISTAVPLVWEGNHVPLIA